MMTHVYIRPCLLGFDVSVQSNHVVSHHWLTEDFSEVLLFLFHNWKNDFAVVLQ